MQIICTVLHNVQIPIIKKTIWVFRNYDRPALMVMSDQICSSIYNLHVITANDMTLNNHDKCAYLPRHAQPKNYTCWSSHNFEAPKLTSCSKNRPRLLSVWSYCRFFARRQVIDLQHLDVMARVPNTNSVTRHRMFNKIASLQH